MPNWYMEWLTHCGSYSTPLPHYHMAQSRDTCHIWTSHVTFDSWWTSNVTYASFMCDITYSLFPRRWDSKCSSKPNRNPRWSKFMSLFKWAVWKETCDDHRGFRFAFRWPFRVSSSRKRAIWLVHMWHMTAAAIASYSVSLLLHDMTQAHITWHKGTSHVTYGSFICDMWLPLLLRQLMPTLLHTFATHDMPRSYVKWLVHMWHDAFIFTCYMPNS